ncbi:flagellar basal-body rod protein FlgF [Novosphingobium chloroacetimidivorans]|uniref:Flagellar basal-body rod protein FlgF n=1 Tax=Novosphingobium chloroacetimidivorans TaxID=1428314 RepID=A0A7W7NVD5_9SPHN|nr:flagellar basal body rod protein FlgF [Novosphingobium chloroacetimidivorans]MBB4858126.1 flagellar basal-body rod protein FlgF [Novosphingobium chloroacetimidivorans]
MDRLVYTAVSGMNASMVRERMIASNMANSQTIGFKAEVLRAETVTLDGPQLDVRAMNRSEVKGASMKEGAIVQTGRPLDVAMTGDTMLAVQSVGGNEGYTRRGDLTVSITGVVENGEGLPVLGENGPLMVPPGSMVSIAQDGSVLITDPAQPEQEPQRIDRLKLVSTKGSPLEKDLAGVFRVPGGGVLPVDDNAKVIPESVEQSNVNSSQVLVDMIEAQRLFDMRTKLVSTAKELDEGSSRLMRLD